MKQNRTELYVVSSKYSVVIFNLLLNAVLARILSPSDFGIVSVISVFTVLFNIIADFGIGSAIIQYKELKQEDTNTLFSLTCYLGIMLSLFFCIMSILISKFYNEKIYLLLGCLLSISLFFNTVNAVPNAIIMRDQRYKLVAIRIFIVNAISGLSAVVLAIFQMKYYSLIFQTIVSSIGIFLWNYCSTKPQFLKKISRRNLSKVKEFSKYLFAFNIINYFARNLDNLLIGKILGNAQLGYYDKAYKLMLYPVQNLSYVINPIIHPILSNYKQDINIIYEKYIKLLKFLSLIGVFVSIYSFYASEEIVLILFGKQWVNSIQSLKILSFSIWFQLTASTAGAIYPSIEKTKVLFNSGKIYVSLQVGLLVGAIMVSKDINIIAASASVGLILKFFIEYFMLIKRGFGFSYFSFLKNFIPELFIAFLCIIGMHFGTKVIVTNILLSAAYKFALCGILFFALIVITKQYKYLIHFLK